jgi:hypothetical protein
MLRKKKLFFLGYYCTKGKKLKDAITRASVMALPNFAQPFVIECDASGLGIGAILMKNRRPIAYIS